MEIVCSLTTETVQDSLFLEEPLFFELMKKNLSHLCLSVMILGLVNPVFSQEANLTETSVTEESPSQSTVTQGVLQDAPPPVEEETPKAEPVPANITSFLKGLSGATNVDEFSGGLGYGYDLWVPGGRKGMTPPLSLSYNHQRKDFSSFAGYGWDLNTHSIFRIAEKGVDKLYTNDNFSASFFGSSDELVLIDAANGIYGAKNEASYNKYQYQNGSWTVWDVSGRKYTFGSQADNRLFDSSKPSNVYQWMLEKVEDTNGNFMTFTYFKDSGKIYPSTILYTGHGSDQGIYKIAFNRKSRSSYTDYRKGFKSEAKHLLDSVDIFFIGNGSDELVRTYKLTHQEKNAAIGQLTDVQVFAPDGSGLPSTQFGYYDGTETEEGTYPNLLSSIIQPEKGETRFFYKPSTALKDNGLPFVLQTLWKVVSQTEPTTPWYATVYEYEGGHYFYDHENAYKKEYAGFHKVKITDPEGHYIQKYFHQSENAVDDTVNGKFDDHISKKGKVYRQETYDQSGAKYQEEVSRWVALSLPDVDPEKERFSLSLLWKSGTDFEKQASGKSRATSYQYDAFGNVTEETQYGEVNILNTAGNFEDIGSDKKTVSRKYAHDYTNHLHQFSSESIVKDFLENLIAQSQSFYDNEPFGDISKGNLTKARSLISTNLWQENDTVYNSYGLPTEVKNPRGFTTTTTYDAYNLYPATQTNTLGHVTQNEYDYRFGQPSITTDPNGMKNQTVYDDFGRMQYEKMLSPWDGSTFLTLKTYQYDWRTYPISITERIYPHSDIEVVSRSYLDGFGRTLQTRVEHGDGYDVAQQTYDPRGNISETTIPVLQGDMTYSKLPEPTPHTQYEYDGLARITQIVRPFGTDAIAYTPWKKVLTNANNIPKEFVFDAFGQVTNVTEYLENTPQVTNYDWNQNGNLEKITDTEGNYKAFTYDKIGNLLTETLWARAANTNPSQTVWQRDLNNNPTTITALDGSQTMIVYDDLDRPISEDLLATTGIESTYTYDTGDHALGRLSSLTKNDGYAKSLIYDILGQVISEEKTFDSVSYTTQFVYNLLGQILEVTYPDSFAVQYVYGSDGKLEQVIRDSDTIVSNIDYAPYGLKSAITYGNGDRTDQVFDTANLYRLKQKKTRKVDNTVIQDLNYAYDGINNVTQIEEKADNAAKKVTDFIYDDLDRLTNVTVTGSAQDYVRDYEYDRIGNLTYRTDKGPFVYDGVHPHQLTSADGNILTYDINGNLTSNGIWNHTWNAKNQLLQSQKADNSKTVVYAYDESGTRWKKKNETSGKETLYINNYFDVEDSKTKRYVFADEMKVASVEGTVGESSGGSSPVVDEPNLIVIDYGDICNIPSSGDWIVTVNCYVSGTEVFGGNVTVDAGTLTVMEDGFLDLNLQAKFVKIKDNGGLLIKHGGTVK